MEYELCKKLKDAGFPIPKKYDFKEFVIEGDEHIYRVPFLSELIDACEGRFEVLTHFDTWKAYEVGNNDGAGAIWEKVGVGSTPEEAVAMLWLELQK